MMTWKCLPGNFTEDESTIIEQLGKGLERERAFISEERVFVVCLSRSYDEHDGEVPLKRL